jgi:hypothetical protein
VKREPADGLVEGVLQRLTATPGHPLAFIGELHVFGSYARGAPEPDDVDLAVQYTPDAQYRAQQVWYMSRSRHPDTDLRAALTAGSRGMQFQFQELDNLHAAGIETTLLWRRGENLETALERLAAIRPDPEAGRAPRDEMPPAFDGIDRWVPRPVRQLLTAWENEKAVTLHQVDLPDILVHDVLAAQAIEQRWVAGSSPLRRAANNASAFLESRSVNLRAVHLHGHDVAEELTPHYIGLGWCYIDAIHHCLTECTASNGSKSPTPHADNRYRASSSPSRTAPHWQSCENGSEPRADGTTAPPIPSRGLRRLSTCPAASYVTSRHIRSAWWPIRQD